MTLVPSKKDFGQSADSNFLTTGSSMASAILGTGHYVPALEKSNGSLESSLDLPFGWIHKRTGFRARRIVGSGQATSDLAIAAGSKAIADSGVSPSDIGTVLLATSTPDFLLPSTAPFVASQLGLKCGAIDLMNACSGFLYGLIMGHSLVLTTRKPVLLIAANVLSRRVDPKDQNTVGIFGDGAGAVVLGPQTNVPLQDTDSYLSNDESFLDHHSSPEEVDGLSHLGKGFIDGHWNSEGENWDQIMIPCGGSRNPFDKTDSNSDSDTSNIKMQMKNGKFVFRSAVESMESCCKVILDRQGMSTDDMDFLVCHQASQRIVKETGRRLGFSENKILWKLENFGNSSAATLPIALDLGRKDGTLTRGNRLLLTAAGAGMTAAAAIVDL